MRVFDIQNGFLDVQCIDDVEISCLPWSSSNRSSLQSLPKISILADRTANALFGLKETIILDESYSLTKQHSIDILRAYNSAYSLVGAFSCASVEAASGSMSPLDHCLLPLDDPRLSYDHLKPHPSGRYLGFVVSEQDAKATSALFCLCVLDVARSRVIWTWHSRFDHLGGFEAPAHPVEFTFHPQETLIAWALQGASAAICDFTSEETPQFLDCR